MKKIKSICICVCFIALFFANISYSDTLYGVSYNRNIFGFDVSTGSLATSFNTNLQYNGGLAFGPDGYLYGKDQSKGIEVYDVSTGTLVNSFTTEIGGIGGDMIIPSSNLVFGPTVIPEPISSSLSQAEVF